jgi:hypothetical protein
MMKVSYFGLLAGPALEDLVYNFLRRVPIGGVGEMSLGPRDWWAADTDEIEILGRWFASLF